MNITQEEREAVNVDQAFNESISIPIVPHILVPNSSSDEQSYLTPGEFNEALTVLNDAFLDVGFKFKACAPNYLPYSAPIQYGIHPTSNEFVMANKTAHPRALNIYFVPDAIATNGESVCGWASFPGEYYQSGKNWIVIRNDCATNESTLIHEVGHYFNLYHTHQNENAQLGITAPELADGSSCGLGIGDELCDTQAEPYRGGNGINGIVNEDCEILCEYNDKENNLYIPAIDDQQNVSAIGRNYNYMSYAPYKCRNHFTAGQIKRMKISYLFDRDYLSLECPGHTPNEGDCDSAKDIKVLYKLYASINGPVPGSWAGVTFNKEGCVTKIDLDGTNLNEANKLIGSIPVEIEDLFHLETLILSNQNICGTIPASVGNLPKLKRLDLSGNEIMGSIPVELEKLVNLEQLNLSANNFCGYIPHQLSTLSNLSQLFLADNPFTGCIHSSIQSLCNHIATDNFCNGLNTCTNCNEEDWSAIKAIYKKLGGINSLQMDDFSHNLYEADNTYPGNCNLEESPFITLNDFGRISEINLSNYGLSGVFPSEIGSITDLEFLFMSNNTLLGMLPESLGELTKLKHADLAYNHVLKGNLPVNLTKLCGKTTMLLWGNRFDPLIYNDFCAGKGGYYEAVDDYVMPGDFNNDKKVNSVDYVYWHKANGTSNGIERQDANNAWLPQFCDDWNGTSLNINHKHQDANGDGQIDQADLDIFHLNYGKGTEDDDFFGADLPNTNNLKLEITAGDGQNGFFLNIKEVENVQILVFSIGLSNSSYYGASLDYTGVTNTPIFEDIQWVESSRHLEITLQWDPNFPPPIDEDSFGRLHIIVADEGDTNAFLRVNNINILSNNALVHSDGMDKVYNDVANVDGFCVPDQLLNRPLNVSDVYKASEHIIAYGNAHISGCTNVTFKAGQSVTLNPGFKNQHGTVFCAQIEYCEPIPPAKNALIEQSELSVYPNPAKNQATIAFDLTKAGKVSLKITDMTGKHITTLLDGTTKEKGKHTVQYNTNELPTGVYYCTLKHNETLSTQKLIVVK